MEVKKQSAMREVMLKTFGVNLDRVLCVSSKEAKDAKSNDNQEMLVKSNLPELERRIYMELQNFSPEIGLETCLGEIIKIMGSIKDADEELAIEIFSQAQRPVSVFLNKCPANSKLSLLARDIYGQYSR